MPLTGCVEFKAVLQVGFRVQVPRVVRWRFKLECDQVLRVAVSAVGVLGGWEIFHGRMDKSGRITVPRLTRELLLSRAPSEQSLVGMVMQVRLEPA